MKWNKTLVILTPGFPKDEADTACLTYLQDFVLSFSRLYPAVELKIITFQYPFKRGHYRWNHIDVYSAGGANSKLLRGLTWFNVLLQLYKQHKRSDLLVMQSFWLGECAFVGQLFSKLDKVKHVAVALGQDVRQGNNYLRWLQLDGATPVAISEALIETLYETAGYKIKTMIPFGIDTRKFRQVPAVYRSIDIIGVGSLIPLKNYTLFIDIIAELKKEFPQIKAVIVGDGPEMPMLAKMIAKKQLVDTIVLAGQKPHEEVLTAMQNSKILLHTSSYEGESMVMLEALAAGLTVVSFDLGKLHPVRKKVICNTKTEMIAALKNLLNIALDFEPVILQEMDDTVHAFAKLYGIQ